MKDQINRNIDAQQNRVDKLDGEEDNQVGQEEVDRVVFGGINRFQQKMAKMDFSEEVQEESLTEVLVALEKITGVENLAEVSGFIDGLLSRFLESVEEDTEIDSFAQVYIETRQQKLSEGKKYNDIEDAISSGDIGSYAYVPFLEHMIEDFKDNEWIKFDDSGEREEDYAKQSVELVFHNLRILKEKLVSHTDKSSAPYQALLKIYNEDVKKMVEITGSIGDNESTHFRSAELAAEFTREAILSMSLEEAVAWTTEMMDQIDDNYFQSHELEQVYGVFSNTCKGVLQSKLVSERQAIQEGDIKAFDKNTRQAIDLANLFTDREGDIDSGLTDPDWAAGILRGVLNFDALMEKHFEKEIESPDGEYQEKLSEKTGDVLELIEASDELDKNTKERMSGNVKGLEAITPKTLQEFSQQYGNLSATEALLRGEEVDSSSLVKEVSDLTVGATESFLSNGMWGADVSEVEALFGSGFSFSSEQREAYELLKDIQGIGWGDFSDKTIGYAAEGVKIAGIIGVGILAGVASGGTGFVAMAASYGATVGLGATASGIIGAGVIGGGSMTAVSSLMYGKGHDEGDFLKEHGLDFAVNSLGFGIGRGLNTLRLAAVGDDVAHLGTRLSTAGIETGTDLTTGFAMEIGLMSVQQGISFSESWEMFKSNPMMWGLGMGMGAFGVVGSMKRVNPRNLSPEALHVVDQSQKTMRGQMNKLKKMLKDTGKTPQDAFESGDIAKFIRENVPEGNQAHFREALDQYTEAQKQFSRTINEADLIIRQKEGESLLENLDVSLEGIEKKLNLELAAATKNGDTKGVGKLKKQIQAVEKIKSGEATLESGYQGVRDLKSLTIEEQQAVASKILENSGLKVEQILDVTETVGTLRKLELNKQNILEGQKLEAFAECKDIDDALKTVREALEGGDDMLKRLELDATASPENLLIGELLKDLDEIGNKSITGRERAVILRDSLEYLSDYQKVIQEGGFAGSSVENLYEVFDLVRQNQRNLAHQTIVDRLYLTGSDHGTLHILEADMSVAAKIADAKIAAGEMSHAEKVLMRQALVDHDMGYTNAGLKRFTDGSDQNIGEYFAMTKDHPLYSGLLAQSRGEQMTRYFGVDNARDYQHAVLDHSAVQYDLSAARGAHLIEGIIQRADCLGVSADIKMMKIFKDPFFMGRLIEAQEVAVYIKKTKGSLKTLKLFKEVGDGEGASGNKNFEEFIKNGESMEMGLARLREESSALLKSGENISDAIVRTEKQNKGYIREAQNIKDAAIGRVEKEYGQSNPDLAASYKQSLESFFNPEDPGFPFARDIGSHSVDFGEAYLGGDGQMVVKYNVNDIFFESRKIFEGLEGVNIHKARTNAIVKSMEDFGYEPLDVRKLSDHFEETLKENPKRVITSQELLDEGLIRPLDGGPKGNFEFGRTQKGRGSTESLRLGSLLRRDAFLIEQRRILLNPESSSVDVTQAMRKIGKEVRDYKLSSGEDPVKLMGQAQDAVGDGDLEKARAIIQKIQSENTNGLDNLSSNS